MYHCVVKSSVCIVARTEKVHDHMILKVSGIFEQNSWGIVGSEIIVTADFSNYIAKAV